MLVMIGTDGNAQQVTRNHIVQYKHMFKKVLPMMNTVPSAMVRRRAFQAFDIFYNCTLSQARVKSRTPE
eukprot:15445105-Alexandrium_andersonii.AAC.1